MNRCENYTLSCEAKDCSECDMFSWDGTGDNPRRSLIMTIKIIYYNNESKTIGGVVAIDFDGETGEISIQTDNNQFLKYKMVKEVQVFE